MIKNILTALTESLILESYKDVKTRFVNDGADKDEVSKLLDLHKKLKDMNRLKKDEVNIDVFTKGKSFDEFKSLMSRYSEKDTATKTDKWNELKNKIVAENNEWTVYAIDTPEEAYLFHGLVKWCISSGTKEKAKEYFNEYRNVKTSIFFAVVRKNPIGDEYDYIMDQYNWKYTRHTYWDAEDHDHTSLNSLNIPSYKNATDETVAKLKADAKNAILKKLKLNNNGTYSCDGSLYRDDLDHFIENGKLTIKFKEVGGDFICTNCGLTSLEGCPEKVGEDFYCNKNKLTTLKGAPKTVGGSFFCSDNLELTSLEGAPKTVSRGFYCYNSKLTSLKGAPKNVGVVFVCSDNKLTSLEGAPKSVVRVFDCSDNKLTSLEGAPKEVDGDFKCYRNKLTSLKGAPEKVGGCFYCEYNNLTSLEGAPKEVGEDFNLRSNKYLKSLDGIGKVKGKIYSDID